MSYRLKKKYPTLPPDWEEGMEVHIKGKNPYYSTVDSKYRQHYLYIYDIENNPEFWEEVSEKDYEILYVVIPEGLGGVCNSTYNKIPAENYKMNSVKRLSDGEVFTVGREVQLKNDSTTYLLKTLTVNSTTGGIYVTGTRLDGSAGFGQSLEKLVKVVKIPIGRTVDTSEPIYENDKVFLLTCNWTCPEVTMTKKEYFKIPPILFKSKEAAQQYIFMNKPCLSYAEVLDGLKKSGVISVGSIELIVRNKLKLDNGS